MRIFADAQTVFGILRAMNNELRRYCSSRDVDVASHGGKAETAANHKADITPETHGEHDRHDSLVKCQWEHPPANERTGRKLSITISKQDLCVSSFNSLRESHIYHSTKLTMRVTLSRGRHFVNILSPLAALTGSNEAGESRHRISLLLTDYSWRHPSYHRLHWVSSEDWQ